MFEPITTTGIKRKNGRTTDYDPELESKKAILLAKQRLKDFKKNDVNLSFPIEAFPERIQNILKVVHECYRLPVDYHATSILVAASVAIGNGYAAHYKKRQVYPPVLYAAIVGLPSIGKTPAIDLGMFPIARIEQKMREDYQVQLEDWKEECYKRRLDNKEEPPRPLSKDIIIDDATVEAINASLSRNPKGLVLYLDELRAWINSMNSYRKGSDQEYWLKIWSGKFVKVTRAGRTYWIPNPFVSTIGGIQPGVLHSLAGDGRADNGFLARILFAYPDEMKCPEESDIEPDETVFELYEGIIKFIYRLPNEIELPDNEDGIAKVNRVEVPLSYEAKERYIAFLNDLSHQVNDSEDEQVQAILGKLKQYCLRFALILEILELACKCAPEDMSDNPFWEEVDLQDMEALKISKTSIDNAIKMTEYFKLTAYKVIQRFESPVNQLSKYKKLFYESLPEEGFTRQTAFQIAEDMVNEAPECKLSPSTVKRLLSDKSLFTRSGSRGGYTKNYL